MADFFFVSEVPDDVECCTARNFRKIYGANSDRVL